MNMLNATTIVQRAKSSGKKASAKRAAHARKVLPAPREGSISREMASKAVDMALAARREIGNPACDR